MSDLFSGVFQTLADKGSGLSAKQFLLLNTVFVILVVISYLFAKRGSRPPSKLRMIGGSRSTGSPMTAASPKNMVEVEEVEDTVTNWSIQSEGFTKPGPKSTSPPKVKELNVMFSFQGKSWDAYQVLGLPAGSSLQAVNLQYQRLSQGSSSQSASLYQAAYQAILANRQ